MATAVTTEPDQATEVRARQRPGRPPGQRLRRLNWGGGTFGWIWWLIVVVPIYWIIITSFNTRANYFATNPLAPPSSPTLDNYRFVIEADFVQYFVNSVIITIG